MRHALSLLLTCVVFLILTERVASFGAGFIPNYAYLNDRAFRHGDIEEVLPRLAKTLTRSNGSIGWLAFIASLFSFGASAKFSRMDMKRIYFGNWLRDYSQAMDVAGLSRITAHTLLMAVSVFGFMTFGFATAEFEITPERLGVYLPVEHIDNPKGYAEKEGDARQFHPNLRPPVDPQELDVNPDNGMKNYIATEGHSWDTSSAHLRRTLEKCILLGRKAQGKENEDQWESFRLLGSALHTLEDLLAHSNWCELALRRLGHHEVFCHVGDDVLIDTPNGPAPPLVTGTFGSADFMYSVLGEGMDRLSEASMSNLAETMEQVKSTGESHLTVIRTLLSRLSIVGDTSHAEKMEQAENIKAKAYDFDPSDVAPEEIQRFLWHILEWRDAFYKDVLKGIDMIPGLSALCDEITDTLNAFVFTVLDPVLKPLLQDAMDALQDSSKAVIDTDDQYEVFNDPHASDPSHSILAKDHFGLILNEPAGKVARAVVVYSVNLIVKAWHDEDEEVKIVIDKILEVVHHPYFATGSSEIQGQMIDNLKQWIAGLKPHELEKTLQALTKESVREGGNKRLATEEEAEAAVDSNGAPEVDTRSLDGEGRVRKETATEDRGIYYEIRPGLPVYSRFDGLHEQQEAQMDRRRRSYAEKSDEDFWRNPYARSHSRTQSEDSLPGRVSKTFHPGYASYAGHPAYSSSTEDNPCAPSAVLAQAEAGYYAVLHQNQRYNQTGRRGRRADVNDGEVGENAFLYGNQGYGGSGSRFAQPRFGYPRNGKAPDNPMQPEQPVAPEGSYRPQLSRTGSVFDRYDSTRGPRGSGAMYRYVGDAGERPAFFVQTGYPEGNNDDANTYEGKSTYFGRDRKVRSPTSYGYQGDYDTERVYDDYGAEKSNAPEYTPFGPT